MLKEEGHNLTRFETFQYYIIKSIFGLLSMLPRQVLLKTGELLGRLWYILDRGHRRIAMENLERAFGDEKSKPELEAISKKSFINAAKIIFELAWCNGIDIEEFKKHIDIEGAENYHRAVHKGRGVLGISCHIGNWELIPTAAACYDYPVSFTYRPLSYKPLDQVVLDARTRFGAVMIAKEKAMRKILRSLADSKIVGSMLDQNCDWYEGVFVEFFGHMACTNKGMALLAHKTKAPILPLCIVRNGNRYRLVVGPEVKFQAPEDPRDKTLAIENITISTNRAIEEMVRSYPEQWFWVHERWKTKDRHPWPRQG